MGWPAIKSPSLSRPPTSFGCPIEPLEAYKGILDLDQIYALQVGASDGRYVADLVTNPAGFDGKKAVVEKLTSGGDLIALAMGDSSADLPLLNAAKYRIVVDNPNLLEPSSTVHHISAETDLEQSDAILQLIKNLPAAIKRYYPLHEAGRKWKMVAYCHGNVLIGVFYTVAPKTDPSSYGAIVLHRDHQLKDATVWRGYYIRPDSGTFEQITSGDFERHPIVWQQEKPEDRNFGSASLPAPGSAALNATTPNAANKPAGSSAQHQNP
jgi:hypothetical protein